MKSFRIELLIFPLVSLCRLLGEHIRFYDVKALYNHLSIHTAITVPRHGKT
jgi:hypothetical protein